MLFQNGVPLPGVILKWKMDGSACIFTFLVLLLTCFFHFSLCVYSFFASQTFSGTLLSNSNGTGHLTQVECESKANTGQDYDMV